MNRYTRRRFLGLATGAALAAACASPAQNPDASSTPPARSLAATSAPRPEPSPEPTLTVRQAVPPPDKILITGNDAFYAQSYSKVPQVEAAGWRVTIDGLVNKALTFSLADLKVLPAVEIMRTLECIGNPVGGPQIGNAVWTGTYLKPLLDEAGIQPAATRIKFEAADGYKTAVDLKYIVDERSFLAYEMNGQALTAHHGFPVRVFFPGSYGQKMPKWVTRLELIDHEFEGYWERQGWSENAQVRTNSIIKEPRTGATYARQAIVIWGVAYAGKRDIARVEVKFGDNEWQPANLLAGPTNEVWTQWSFDWRPPAAGSYKIQVRATDVAGATQNRIASGMLDGFPNGSDAIHQIYVKIAEG